jgi:TatD DNase family protein
VIVETDCPYLAPMPHRGKRCEPSFLPHVAAGLAAVKGWSEEECATKTSDAFFNLFEKVPRP